MRAPQVAVIGAGVADDVLAARAFEVGQLLAAAGCVVVCGGLGGVMESVARGARSRGGTVVGILPGTDPAAANDGISLAVATGIGHARNLAVVASGQVVVAVGGAWGTASEIALARVLGRPVVVLDPGPPIDGEGVHHAPTPERAVDLALGLAGLRPAPAG
ncbi:MAG: TIGR00725 family protein [Thermoleophilia bacterium]